MKSSWDCQKNQVARGKVIPAGGDHDHRLMDRLPHLYPRLARWRNWACVPPYMLDEETSANHLPE